MSVNSLGVILVKNMEVFQPVFPKIAPMTVLRSQKTNLILNLTELTTKVPVCCDYWGSTVLQ